MVKISEDKGDSRKSNSRGKNDFCFVFACIY